MSNLTVSLIEQAKEGDEAALGRLVEENTGLVRSIAVRFMGRGVDFEDLCQIGHMGMIKAIRNFDLQRGTAFSTYAVPLIMGEIKRFLRDDGEIKVSRELKRKAAVLRAAREQYLHQQESEPSVSVLAEICGFTQEEVVESLSATANTLSLAEQIGEDGRLEDIIGVDFTPEINERIALRQAVEKLETEEREIIILRYFRGLTQAETGRILGVSQVKVSRKEAKAILKLKEELC